MGAFRLTDKIWVVNFFACVCLATFHSEKVRAKNLNSSSLKSISDRSSNMQKPYELYTQLSENPNCEVIRTGNFDYYGHCDGVSKMCNDFLDRTTIGLNCENIVSSFIRAIPKSTNYVWFTIRCRKLSALTAAQRNEIPRWHRDGKIWRTPSVKYAVTIIGPSTLLLEESAHCTEVWSRVTDSEVDREMLAKEFAGEKIVEILPRQIISFTNGKKDSPIHSEPDLTSDRIFMSVVFGSKDQVRDCARKYNCQFYEFS